MRRTERVEDGIVDPIAIERRMAGDKSVPLTRAERVELVRRWRASGRALTACDQVAGLNARRYRPRPGGGQPGAGL